MLLSYTESGSGLPLVLLHAFPLDSRMWSNQIPVLSAAARTIALDMRGFGKTPETGPFTLGQLADDVHETLVSLNAIPCILAGLSMGGYICFEYIKKYADDLRGLILMDTKAAADSAETKAGRDEMIQFARTGGSRAVAEKMLRRVLCQKTLDHKPQFVQQVQQMMLDCSAQTIQHALAAMRDRPDHIADLSRIKIPTLILVGQHDASTPPDVACSMHEQIRGSKLAVIPDAGHLSAIEQPRIVNHNLLEFMNTFAAMS